MAVTTFKCPHCDAELIFEPETQLFHCEYCGTRLSQEQLAPEPPEEAAEQEENQEEGELAVYSCPSCGAEVATDATTAATFCFFCHNPVILAGRLQGKLRPNRVLPFAIDKEQALENFRGWIKKKRLLPKAFYSKEQIESITGVYFPYWVADYQMRAELATGAHKTRVWTTGDVEHTERKNYRVTRAGRLRFPDITKVALAKANIELAEGVQPFDFTAAKPFSAAYLSGFQAEKRDVERGELEEELEQEVRGYTHTLLKNSLKDYDAIDPGGLSAAVEECEWNYTLLPVWTLTYHRSGKLYYYALNGQTGKVCGRLPVDWRKLLLLFFSVSVPTLMLLLLGGYFL